MRRRGSCVWAYHRPNAKARDTYQTGGVIEKGIFYYAYLLNKCVEQFTPYITIMENDTVAMDGWYHRTMAAIRESEQVAALRRAKPDFLYLRLFYTEQFLDWTTNIGSRLCGDHIGRRPPHHHAGLYPCVQTTNEANHDPDDSSYLHITLLNGMCAASMLGEPTFSSHMQANTVSRGWSKKSRSLVVVKMRIRVSWSSPMRKHKLHHTCFNPASQTTFETKHEVCSITSHSRGFGFDFRRRRPNQDDLGCSLLHQARP
jgi:hypothetical protein